MRVQGRVVKGVGESKGFLSIDWVAKALTDAFEFTPFPGTLNLTLDDPRAQEVLKERGQMRLVHRTEGFCDAILIKAVLNGQHECGIVIPLVKEYDERLLEVVAPVHLKETLHIDDGDVVTLDLDMDLTHDKASR
jgi:riboflavin kinase